MIARNSSNDGEDAGPNVSISAEKKPVVFVKAPSEDPDTFRVRSRSILRVPSLATRSTSSETHRASNHQSSPGSDGLERLSNAATSGFGKVNYNSINVPIKGNYGYPVGGFTAWTPHGTGNPNTIGSGHPAFVNYRADEMVMMDHNHQQQQLHFKFSSGNGTSILQPRWPMNVGGDVQAHQPPSSPTSSPIVAQRIPPYSPIRIRSSRGRSRHLSSSIPPGRHTPPTTAGLAMDVGISSSSSFTPSGPPARSFPVSNRGMGRRPIPPPLVQSRQYDSQTIMNETSAPEELQMLKNTNSSLDNLVEASQTKLFADVGPEDAKTNESVVVPPGDDEQVTIPSNEIAENSSAMLFNNSNNTTNTYEEREAI
jgi:hypothetical protein